MAFPAVAYAHTCLESDKTYLEACAPPEIAVTPSTHNFGTVKITESSNFQTFTIQNTGTDDLLLTSIAFVNGDISDFFVALNTCGAVLVAGSSCVVSIQFAPGSTGNKSATLRIVNSDADEGTTTISLTGTAVASDPTKNCAEVIQSNRKDTDSTPANGTGNTEDDRACITLTTTTPAADLRLTKAVDKTIVRPGEQMTFTLTLTNSGPASAQDVKVKDLIVAPLSFLSASPSQGTYDASTGVWDIGTVAVGTVTLTITVRVN